MAIVEIILGERPPTGVQTPIEYSVLSEDFCTTINGELVREPVGRLRERFAKLKARDNLLGAVLANLGADPGARETEAHNAVGRVLNAQAALEKISKGLGLDSLATHALPVQVLAMNTELTAALAKAQERVKELEGDAEDHEAAWGEIEEFLCVGEHTDSVFDTIKKMQARLSSLEAPPLGWVQKKIAKVGALMGLEGADLDALHQGVKALQSSSQAEVKALAEENARLRAEVEQERGHKLHAMTAADIAISRSTDFEAEVRILKGKMADADLERMLAEARVSGMAAELQALEHALRSRLPLP